MNKKIFIPLMIFTLILSGCNQNSEETKNLTPSNSEGEISENDSGSMQGTIEKIDKDWNRYTNNILGFSIQYPQKNFLNGNKEYEVKVIEDGNIVYLDEGYNTDNIEKKKDLSDIESGTGIPFAILIQKVSNDEELDKFIKERYGKNCKLGEKKPSAQEGVFDVGIDTSWKNPDPNADGIGPDDCFINYITMFQYSPEKGKVATWDIGQDGNFYTKDFQTVDQEISESFKFL